MANDTAVPGGLYGFLVRKRRNGEADPGSWFWADEAPVLAGLAAAPLQGTAALGLQRGARPGSAPAASEDPRHLVYDARARYSGCFAWTATRPAKVVGPETTGGLLFTTNPP